MINRAYKKNFQNENFSNVHQNKEKIYTSPIANYDQTSGCTNITPQDTTTPKPAGLLVNSTLWSFLLVFLQFSLFFIVVAVVINCFKVLKKEIKCILFLYKRSICSIKEQQTPIRPRDSSRQQVDIINDNSKQQCQKEEIQRKNGFFYVFLITSQIICGLVQSVCTLCFLVVSKSCNGWFIVFFISKNNNNEKNENIVRII